MSITLSLPEPLRSWVEEQTAARGLGTPAAFVEDVLRREREMQDRRVGIERQLLDALESGDPVEVTPEFWEARRNELERRSVASQKETAQS